MSAKPRMAGVVAGSRSSSTDRSQFDMIAVSLGLSCPGVITNSKCNSCASRSKQLTLQGLFV